MSALITCLSDEEKVAVGNELEKLFMFQDRPLAAPKKALLVSEISKKGMSFDAIVKGIRNLFSEDLKEVKLSRIENSIREFMPKSIKNERYEELKIKLLREAVERYGKEKVKKIG